MKVLTLTEERRTLVGISGPAARHEVDERLSPRDVTRHTVQSGVRARAAQDAEHYLHGVGSI